MTQEQRDAVAGMLRVSPFDPAKAARNPGKYSRR